jgi:hypothetical protein
MAGREEKSSLAFRTNSKKFEFVGDAFKVIFSGDLFLNFLRKTFVDFNNF